MDVILKSAGAADPAGSKKVAGNILEKYAVFVLFHKDSIELEVEEMSVLTELEYGVDVYEVSEYFMKKFLKSEGLRYGDVCPRAASYTGTFDIFGNDNPTDLERNTLNVPYEKMPAPFNKFSIFETFVGLYNKDNEVVNFLEALQLSSSISYISIWLDANQHLPVKVTDNFKSFYNSIPEEYKDAVNKLLGKRCIAAIGM